jgi:NAD(P)-dependent dehydrogenase (short-subunit alcohol dehydrogenase family)
METMETIALVTGANKGIGHEVARLLGEAGAVVLVGTRSEECGTQAVGRPAEQGIEARHVRLDVTDQACSASNESYRAVWRRRRGRPSPPAGSAAAGSATCGHRSSRLEKRPKRPWW